MSWKAKRALTQNAHHIPAFPDLPRDGRVARPERGGLRGEDVRARLVHDVDDVAHAVQVAAGRHVEEEAPHARRAELGAQRDEEAEEREAEGRGAVGVRVRTSQRNWELDERAAESGGEGKGAHMRFLIDRPKGVVAPASGLGLSASIDVPSPPCPMISSATRDAHSSMSSSRGPSFVWHAIASRICQRHQRQ